MASSLAPAAGSDAASTAARTAVGAVPAPAPGLQVLGPLQGSGYEAPPWLVRRADGQTLQLTPMLAAVLDEIDGDRDPEAIAQRVADAHGLDIAPDDVEYLIESKLRPLGVLASVDGSVPDAATSNPLLALRCRYVITNTAVTNRITAPFTWLFRPGVVLGVLVSFAAVVAWLSVGRGIAPAARDVLYDPGLLLLVFALTIVSCGFHELGHAAACRYGGGRPGAMGAGLYLVWPAFYTDVSDSYRLDRRDRLRVDLGGLYFNAVFGVGAFVLWAITGWEALLVLVPLQLLQMLRQLAPFVRLDGYHVLADLTGVPDLFAKIKPILRSLLPWRWGRGDAAELRPFVRVVVTAWVLLVIPVLLIAFLMMVVALPRLVATAFDSVGIQWSQLTERWTSGELAGAGVDFVSILAITMPVASVSYLVVRVTRRFVRRVWAASEDNPALRSATVLTAIFLLLAMGASWWPQGQYEPIRSDERGTVVDGARTLVALNAAEAIPVSAVTPAPAGASASPETGSSPVGVATGTGEVSAPIPGVPFLSPRHTFALPEAPGVGDNQALAVNYGDGSTVIDTAFSMFWVLDGLAHQANQAYALASCAECVTLAVAFQLILIIGSADTVVPVNEAVAINHTCVACVTAAIAMQLIFTILNPLSDDALAELAELWEVLRDVEAEVGQVPLAETYAALTEVGSEIQTLLESEGAFTAVDTDTGLPAVDDDASPPADDPASTTSTTTATTSAEPDPTTTTTSTTAPPESTTTTDTTAPPSP